MSQGFPGVVICLRCSASQLEAATMAKSSTCLEPHRTARVHRKYDTLYLEIPMQCSIYKSTILVALATMTIAAVPASHNSPSSDLQFIDRISAHLTSARGLARTAEAPAASTSTNASAASGSDKAMIDQFVRRHRAAIPGASGGRESRSRPTTYRGNPSFGNTGMSFIAF